jgi:hypothetical protein
VPSTGRTLGPGHGPDAAEVDPPVAQGQAGPGTQVELPVGLPGGRVEVLQDHAEIGEADLALDVAGEDGRARGPAAERWSRRGGRGQPRPRDGEAVDAGGGRAVVGPGDRAGGVVEGHHPERGQVDLLIDPLEPPERAHEQARIDVVGPPAAELGRDAGADDVVDERRPHHPAVVQQGDGLVAVHAQVRQLAAVHAAPHVRRGRWHPFGGTRPHVDDDAVVGRRIVRRGDAQGPARPVGAGLRPAGHVEGLGDPLVLTGAQVGSHDGDGRGPRLPLPAEAGVDEDRVVPALGDEPGPDRRGGGLGARGRRPAPELLAGGGVDRHQVEVLVLDRLHDRHAVARQHGRADHRRQVE